MDGRGVIRRHVVRRDVRGGWARSEPAGQPIRRRRQAGVTAVRCRHCADTRACRVRINVGPGAGCRSRRDVRAGSRRAGGCSGRTRGGPCGRSGGGPRVGARGSTRTRHRRMSSWRSIPTRHRRMSSWRSTRTRHGASGGVARRAWSCAWPTRGGARRADRVRSDVSGLATGGLGVRPGASSSRRAGGGTGVRPEQCADVAGGVRIGTSRRRMAHICTRGMDT
jgi:hypothetical protein